MKRFSFPLERVRLWRAGQAALEELKLEHLREAAVQAEQDKTGRFKPNARSSDREVLGQPSIASDRACRAWTSYRVHSAHRIREIENRERQAARHSTHSASA